MRRLRFNRLLTVACLAGAVAWGQPARKQYCSICNDTEKIKAVREQTGSCADYADRYEQQVLMTERDYKQIDITPHRALLEQCRADVLADQDRRRAVTFPDDVERLFVSHSPDECVTAVTGPCMFDIQFGQLKGTQAIALIKELAHSPIPATAARFQKAQAALDALPAKLAGDIDRLAGLAKTALDDARRFRKDSLVVASDQVKRGLKACGYALTFDPNHAGCLKQKAALEALGGELAKEREAFYGTAFHKQNVGKVLFTADEGKLASESAGDFKASFKAGEPLAAVVYLEYPVGMMSGDVAATTTVSITVESDGKKLGAAAWYVAPEEAAHRQAWTTFIAMPPSVKDVADLYTTSDLAAALASLPEGKHQVLVTVGVLNADGSKGVEGASGTFEYDATAGQDQAKAVSDALAGRVLDEARMPKAELKDAKLEKAMLADAANNEFGDKPQRLVITDRTFAITRNWLGVILRRSIHTAIATKGKDGSCMVRRMEFTQQSQGKGYGPPTSSYPSDEYPIRCENVKK